MKGFKVVADQRERNTELLEGLMKSNMDVTVKTLHVGDFIVSDRVCIERKTVPDFESSVINGRLFEQVKRMKEHYDFPILIIEGDADDFRMKSSVINGTIASLYIDYGIVAMASRDAESTAELIASIAKHEQDGESREPSLKGGARAYSHEQFQEYVIGNLPGVGAKLARALLKRFGNIKGIADADVETLMKVEKIGRIKAQRIHDTMNRGYSPRED